MSGPIVEVLADGTPGGGATAVLGLCKDLLAAGREVLLVTQRDSYAAEQGAALGMRVHGLEFFTSRLDPRIGWSLTKLLAAEAPALVHAHGGRAANPLSWRWAGRRPCPLVYTVHGYHFLAKSPAVRVAFRYAEQRLARRADHLIFVSQSDRAIAAANGFAPSRASVILNGVDPADLGEAAVGERGGDLVFLSRMHRQKNPMAAVEMMLHLRDLPTRLSMIGGGDLEGPVRERVAELGLGDRVAVLGPLARPAALDHLRRARLMIFPSLWEGLPIAPIEALFLGVPVVGPDISGLDEVVVSGRTGSLLQDASPERLAAEVRRLLSDPVAWARLSSNARTDGAARFSRAANTSAHLRLYDGEIARLREPAGERPPASA